MRKYDVLVIGGGVNGLAAAYHLSHQKGLKVAVLEQHLVGNSFGGSHGASRIMRSVYINPGYIKLLQRAQLEEWPALERDLETQLIYPNPACYYGKGKIFEKYAQGALSCDLAIESLDVGAARKQFPQFRFPAADAVLKDMTGGVIAAQATLEGIKQRILRNGVVIFEETKVLNIDLGDDLIKTVTDKESFLSRRLIVTAGGWLHQLFHQISPATTSIMQTVAYFRLKGPSESYQIGNFPNWAFIGEGENPVFYGLPVFQSEGIKVSHHVTMGEPDAPLDTTTLEMLVKEHFVSPIEKIVLTERCQYASTPNEDFIIDLLPQDKRVVIGSACSGHGFKFAPLTGKILAELAVNGSTSIPEFNALRSLFTIRSKE